MAMLGFYQTIRKYAIRYPYTCTSRFFSSYATDPENRTTVEILNKNLDYGLMINTFSSLGFRLNNGLFVIGPIAIFPKSILGWNVKSHEDIDDESLSLFSVLEPKPDILVIGVGCKGNEIDPKVKKYLKDNKIPTEILSTEDACSTFNFLNSENRFVAAALIPPKKYTTFEHNLYLQQTKESELESINKWLNFEQNGDTPSVTGGIKNLLDQVKKSDK